MSESHTSASKPTPLLALIALGVVFRYQRGWLAVSLAEAAAQHEVSVQRLSRLVTRAVVPFERTVACLARRGRPPRDQLADTLRTDLSLCRALLEVATTILGKVPLRRKVVGTLIVGAWLRLQRTPGLTQQRFCQAIAIPTRTLRSWLRQAPRRQVSSRDDPVVQHRPAAPLPRKRPPRRHRFAFDVVLPDVQLTADTTDLSAFGVPLKLVAAQDIGGRDQDLFDSIVIDDHESADIVVKVLTETLGDLPGAQVLADRGTPYMARATVEALDLLEAEHAPQREGDPRAKATIERAFESVKAIAAPLLGLTDRLALALPALRQTAIAVPAARLFVSSILRAYPARSSCRSPCHRVQGRHRPPGARSAGRAEP